MNDEFSRDWEGCGHGLIEVLPQHLCGETEEGLSHNTQHPSQDSNHALPKYESRVLPLCQHIWFFLVMKMHHNSGVFEA
jgi:hypothetical protein